jgi:hypothetical protein
VRPLFILLWFALLGLVQASEPWVKIQADSHQRYEIPSSLVKDPNSGEGEWKWVLRFHSPDNAFAVESVGFHGRDPKVSRRPMNTWRRMLRYIKDEQSQVTYSKASKHYFVVVSVDRKTNRKTYTKFWIGNDDASGNAVKSLRIEYPWDRRKEFDPWLERIEASWDPGAEWR